jgi:PAS domain S-box-containing protein
MPKGSVLVVDEKGNVAKDIAQLIINLGYEVPATCNSSTDAVKMAGRYLPDIVLMGIKLKSKKDGIETANEIREKYGIPSIFIAIYHDDETFEKAMKTRPYGYILRPFEDKNLEITLELTFQRLSAEKAVAKQQQTFETECFNFMTILDKFPEFMYVSDPKTYEVLFVCNALRRILKTDTNGKKCYELFQGKSGPCEFCTNDLILKTGQPHVWDNYNPHLKRHFLNTDQIIKWPDGRDVRFETAVDITDQKKIEKMLNASENKYKSLIEQSSYGFFIMNTNFEIIYLNRIARETFDLGRSSELNLKLSDILPPEEEVKALGNLDILSKAGILAQPRIYKFIRADGKIRHAQIQSFPIWKDDAIDGYHGTVMDITDRIEYETKLKENSDFLNAVIKNTSEGMFVIDDDFNYVLINPASGKILGHNPEEWIGKRAGSNKHPDDEAKGLETIMQVMNEGSSEVEIRVKSSDGQYHLLYIRYTLMNLNGKEHILGMVTDITESRKAEEALKESEERFRSIFENTSDGILVSTTNGDFVFSNLAMSEMLGYTPEKMKTLKVTDIHPQKDLSIVMDVFSKLVSSEIKMAYDLPMQRKDGSVFYVDVKGNIINLKGETCLVGVFRDITERRKIEEALKESEGKYRNLFENSPESIILLDIDGLIIECNNSSLALLGKTHESILGQLFADICTMDTSEKEYFNGAIESVINGSRIEKLELELTMGNGYEIWIETFPTLIKKDDKFYAVQLISRNITETKLKEREVKKKLLRFSLEDGKMYLAKEQHIKTSLDAFRELLLVGYSGSFISRSSKKEYAKKMDLAYTHLTISETGGQDNILPEPKLIFDTISTTPRRSVLMMDCIEYLVSRIGEKKTLNLIQDIRDLATRKNLIVLMSIDSAALTEKTIRLVEKETHEILPSESLRKISDKLLDVIKFIDSMNRELTRPTYSQIGAELEMSKPTVRARIKQLVELGIVAEKSHGRMKMVELTDKGKQYLVH